MTINSPSILLTIFVITALLVALMGCSDESSNQSNVGVEFSGSLYEGESKSICYTHLVAGTGGAPDQLLCHTSYALAYNYNTKQADWAQYHITTDYLESATNVYYRENLQEDVTLPEAARPLFGDYLGTAYHYGQYAPGLTVGDSAVTLADSFLLSNLTPQFPGFRQSGWAQLEEYVRQCIRQTGELVIVTGPIYNTDTPATVGSGVAIPDAYFKLLLKPTSPAAAWAFMLPNTENPRVGLMNYLTSVDDIESRTGLDFFNTIKDDIENVIETNTAPACNSDISRPTTPPAGSAIDHATTAGLCKDCHYQPSAHLPALQTCDDCHSSDTWMTTIIIHNFPSEPCSNCHTNPSPPHVEFTLECDACHLSTTNWIAVRFDHRATNDPCTNCHESAIVHPVYGGEPCSVCHSVENWLTMNYQHLSTDYPGDHRHSNCLGCHSQNNLVTANWTSVAYKPFCAGCHESVFNRTINVARHKVDSNGNRTVEANKDCGAAGCHQVDAPAWF